MLIRIIAVVALVCVVARPGWSAEWERIAEEEARIVFYPPGLSSGEFRKRSETYSNMEWAMWRGFGGMPRAEVSLNMLFPGRHYTREWKLEAITHNWNFFKNKELNISNKNKISNVLGLIIYQQFAAEDLHCVSFLHSWGPFPARDTNNNNVRPRHINGYYCDRSALSEDTVKAVLGGIGVRGHKVPAKTSGHGVLKQEGDFRAANLQGASFRNASLQGFNFEGANLRKANLSGARLQKANLDGAILVNAYLALANLQGASFRNANFQKASLNAADLLGANFQGADLSGARGLTQEQLDKACGDENTKLPKNLTIKRCPKDGG